MGARDYPPPIVLTLQLAALQSSPSPTSVYLVCKHRSYRLASPWIFHWRGAIFSTPIRQGHIICHHQNTRGLDAGSLNSKRSAEYAPLGLSRTRASGKEYPDYRGADSLTAEVGHQGGDSAKSGESVRSWIRIKSGLSSRFSSLPHPPLLSSPLLSSHLFFSSASIPSLVYLPLPSLLTFAPLLSCFLLNLLTERTLGDFRSSPLHRLKCGKPVFYFSLSATFTNYYDQATLSLPQASVRLLGRLQQG